MRSHLFYLFIFRIWMKDCRIANANKPRPVYLRHSERTPGAFVATTHSWHLATVAYGLCRLNVEGLLEGPADRSRPDLVLFRVDVLPDPLTLERAFLSSSITNSTGYMTPEPVPGSTSRSYIIKSSGSGPPGLVVTYFSDSGLKTLGIPCDCKDSAIGFIVFREGQPTLLPVKSVNLQRSNVVHHAFLPRATTGQEPTKDFIVATLSDGATMQEGDSGAALVYFAKEPVVLGFLEAQFLHSLLGQGLFVSVLCLVSEGIHTIRMCV
jgi:hypothetical protein